jgi:NADH-ubiquinone oxidoreductase chain 5
LIIIARITKRAQVPFSAWLPAAIAAPTPVSALVHSSTLVTAGVYLMVRFNYVLITEKITTLLAWVGALTMLIAGLAALIEIDIKKIIALSTLSQLGVIVFTLGLGERLLC